VNPRPAYVSVIDPISPAVERVRMVLFRPFNLGKWFVIGFCAWLAQLGTGRGGGNGGGGGGRHRVERPGDIPDELRRLLGQAHDYVLANLNWLVPVAVFAFFIIVGIILLLKWLNSRGQFMFLHCVVRNTAEVRRPWNEFRAHADSLFAFRVVVGIIAFLITATFVGWGIVLAVFAERTLGFTAPVILGLVASGLFAVMSALLAGIVFKLTIDFVVPIMYTRGLRCRAAWRLLLELLGDNMARVVVYLLFWIVIDMVVGLLVVATACATCCIACCLFMLPYIGTVALLPIYIFKRSYSLYYLAQYGPEFNGFGPEPQPACPEADMHRPEV
jgi:hypothetical protein